MRKRRNTEEQIVGILEESEEVMRRRNCAASTGSARRRSKAGSRSTAAQSLRPFLDQGKIPPCPIRKTNDKFRREYRRQADTQALRRHHLRCARNRGNRSVDWDAPHPFQEARCWIPSEGRSRSAGHLHPASVSRSSVLDIFEHEATGITPLTVWTIFPDGPK